MTKTFTKTQLAQYNGKIKPQKYVAIDSIVYDVTQVDAWEIGRASWRERV